MCSSLFYVSPKEVGDFSHVSDLIVNELSQARKFQHVQLCCMDRMMRASNGWHHGHAWSKASVKENPSRAVKLTMPFDRKRLFMSTLLPGSNRMKDFLVILEPGSGHAFPWELQPPQVEQDRAALHYAFRIMPSF
jgi:hypothetical protein